MSHVYLIQQFQGIPIVNSVANVNINQLNEQDAVVSATSNQPLTTNIINSFTPIELNPIQALEKVLGVILKDTPEFPIFLNNEIIKYDEKES